MAIDLVDVISVDRMNRLVGSRIEYKMISQRYTNQYEYYASQYIGSKGNQIKETKPV